MADNAVVKENTEVFSDAKISTLSFREGSCAFWLQHLWQRFLSPTTLSYQHQNVWKCHCFAAAWRQRDYDSYELGGTCVAGGDDEAAGFIASNESTSGAETTGTFLQWPENGNNSRSRHDGLGNLSVTQINNLVANWNNVKTRLSILDNSISASTESSNQNYDINTEVTPPTITLPTLNMAGADCR